MGIASVSPDGLLSYAHTVPLQFRVEPKLTWPLPLYLHPLSTRIIHAPPTTDTLTCSNCTSGEICLLLLRSKVPYCAKIRNDADASGCGGWCSGSNQLCQRVNQSTFRCIHDSECLPDEWQCNNSGECPIPSTCEPSLQMGRPVRPGP